MADTASLYGKRLTKINMIGWLVLIILPPIFFFLALHFSINHQQTVFSLIALATFILIAFQLLPLFISGTFFLLSTMLSGLAPENIVFSGFLSSGFYMILSLLALSYIVSASGLLVRTVRWLLSIVPPRLRLLELFISLFFLLLTAIISPFYARTNLFLNTIDAIDESISFPDRERYLNRLVIIFYLSCAILMSSFMTGEATNLFFYSLLDPITQENVGWLMWFIYALPSTTINLLGFLFIYFIKYRHSIPIIINTNPRANSIQITEKISRNEKIAIVAVITLVFGIIFSSVTYINPPWVAMSVFFLLMITGLIDAKTFKEDIDWPFLFFVGSIMGLGATMEYLNITSVLNQKLSFLQTLVAQGDTYILMISIYLLNIVLLMLVGIVGPVILILMLMPSLQEVGASPWVLVATGCIALQNCFIPSQSPPWVVINETMTKKKYGQFSNFYRTNLYFAAVNFIGFNACIFYWDYLGLI